MPPFQQPNIPAINDPPIVSVVVFLLIIACVVACFVFGLSIAEKSNRRPVGLRPWLMATVWMIVFAGLPMSGVLKLNFMPPPAILMVMALFGIGGLFAFSQFGTRLAKLPVAWLVGFHIFRLPLELVLHWWYEAGTIPIQMTYEGCNFDIVTGVLAVLVLAMFYFRRPYPILLWGFNLIGLTLLLAVVSIAILSTPSPIRQFSADPPVLLPFYFPYSYIVSVAVTGAFVGHIVLFRALLAGSVSSANLPIHRRP